MILKVLLFGPQATLANQREIEIDVPDASVTVEEILHQIGNKLPQLKASLASSRIAVNQQFAEPSEIIPCDAEVAIIGMVSGG